jgi:hypothetical protein
VGSKLAGFGSPNAFCSERAAVLGARIEIVVGHVVFPPLFDLQHPARPFPRPLASNQ